MSDGSHLSGFELGAGARLNGLKVTGLEGQPELAGDGLSSRLALRVALPAQFGGADVGRPGRADPRQGGRLRRASR